MREDVIARLTQYLKQSPGAADAVINEVVKALGATPGELAEAKSRGSEAENDQSAPAKNDVTADSFLPATPTSSNEPKPVTPIISDTEKPAHSNTSIALLGIGIALVIVAFIIIVTSSWSTLSPFIKILTVIIPNALIFSIATMIKGNENYSHIQHGTMATALAILPVSLGTLFFQTNIIPEINPLLFLVSGLIALPIFLYYDVKLKQPYISIYTAITIYALVSIAGQQFKFDNLAQPAAALVVGLAYLATAYYAKRKEDLQHERLYLIASVLTLIFNTQFFISQANHALDPSSDARYLVMTFPSASDLITIGVISALILFGLASLIGKKFVPASRLVSLLQRLIFIAAIIGLYTEIFKLTSMNAWYSLLIIGVGLIILLIGSATNIKLLFFGGLIGVIYGLLSPLIAVISGIGLPIVIFIFGLAAIGLSILFAKLRNQPKTDVRKLQWLNLGYVSDFDSAELANQAREQRQASLARIIVVGLLAVVIAFAIVESISSLFREQSYRSRLREDSYRSSNPQSYETPYPAPSYYPCDPATLIPGTSCYPYDSTPIPVTN